MDPADSGVCSASIIASLMSFFPYGYCADVDGASSHRYRGCGGAINQEQGKASHRYRVSLKRLTIYLTAFLGPCPGAEIDKGAAVR